MTTNTTLQQLEIRNEADTVAVINERIKDGATTVAIPSGYRIEDLEAFAPQRTYPREVFMTDDIKEFTAYLDFRKVDFADNIAFVSYDSETASVTAEVIFGRDKGHSKGRNKAIYTSKLTEEFAAFMQLAKPLKQQEFVETLQDQFGDIRFDHANIDKDKAVAAFSSLTLEQVKTANSGLGVYDYELSASERTALSSTLPLPKQIIISDPILRGLEANYSLFIDLSLTTFDDRFLIRGRIRGLAGVIKNRAQDVVQKIRQTGVATFVGTSRY